MARRRKRGAAGALFDGRYYERFYRDPKTRVGDEAATAALARFVCAWCDAMGVRVRRVLDVGCGLGWWKAPIAAAFPRAKYVGVEASEYLVEEHGWEQGSVVDWRAREPFDLVVCQGVLQYLSHADARAAIANLARLCRGALYLEALTRGDWEENCDKRQTDGDVVLRSGAWYRARLREGFVNCGSGMFLRGTSGLVLYELERLD